MSDNKKYLKGLICALFFMTAVLMFSPFSVHAEEDWVEIVSVTPNSYDNYNDSVTFTATVNYSLQSAEQGIVYLGFNTSQPNYYEIDEEPGAAGQVVSRGTGTVILSKEVTPMNWDTAISRMQQYMQGISYPVTDFKIYANLSEYPHDIPWTPLAIYEAVLTDLPEAETSPDKPEGYDSWSEAYEDFVLKHLFLDDGDRDHGYGDLYDGFAVVSFGLHDMDGNGTPELLIFNGFNGRALRADYIFSYDGAEVRYCGNILSECYYVPDYPGIFSSVFMSGYYMDEEYQDQYSEVTYLNYSTLEEYSVATDRVEIIGDSLDESGKTVIFRTDDEELYNASRKTPCRVQFMTLAEIEEQGWEAFLRIYQERQETAETKAEYKIYCGKGYPDGYEIFDCSLEDCLSKTNSSTYNPQLAHMLIAMCNSVYDGTNIEETFNSFGFQRSDTSISEYMWDGIMLAYGMAKKQIGRGDNERTLVLIVARGTKELIEWGSNVHVAANDKNQHTGFADAANALYDRMVKFLGTSDFSNVEFVITGFSRGAASANILAARLADEGVAQSCIHAYTFACPDTVRITDRTAGRYTSIFNIAEARDYVSWVPRMYLGDAWNKYGQSYWYCEDWNDYQNLKMNAFVYHDQKKYLDYLRSEKSDSEYWDRGSAKNALDAADLRRRLDILYVRGYRKENVPYSGVWCPVDVEIYTSDGRLAGRTADDTAEVLLEDNLYLTVDNGRKHIYFLDEDTYTLRLTATDEGTMRYVVQNIKVDTQEILEEKAFSEIVLTDGKRMTGSIAVGEDGDTDTGGAQLFVLDGDGVGIAEIQENGAEVPLRRAQVEETGMLYAAMASGAVIILVFTAAVILFISRRKHTKITGTDRTLPREERHFCPFCGKKVGLNALFCKNCGAKI